MRLGPGSFRKTLHQSQSLLWTRLVFNWVGTALIQATSVFWGGLWVPFLGQYRCDSFTTRTNISFNIRGNILWHIFNVCTFWNYKKFLLRQVQDLVRRCLNCYFWLFWGRIVYCHIPKLPGSFLLSFRSSSIMSWSLYGKYSTIII